MSVWFWNFKDGVSLNAKFLSKNQYAQRIFFETILQWIMVFQKVPKLYFQSQFLMSKIKFKNINLGDHFLYKHFFLTSILEPIYFRKLCPKFWRTGAPCILKIQWFPLIFGQQSCILGPTILKIPQPNWYY